MKHTSSEDLGHGPTGHNTALSFAKSKASMLHISSSLQFLYEANFIDIRKKLPSSNFPPQKNGVCIDVTAYVYIRHQIRKIIEHTYKYMKKEEKLNLQ